MNNAPPVGSPNLPDFGEVQAKPKNVLGKDDFMKLLMTQLKYQDPINPMNQQEFATQLAQFTSLEQLTNIGTGIKNLHTGMGDEQKLQALGMIGKRIQTQGNEVELEKGKTVTLQHATSADIQPVKASIYDADGKLVREMDISRQDNSGMAKLCYGTAGIQRGRRCPFRKILVQSGRVLEKNGQAQEVHTELSGRVTGVEMDGHSAVLVVETPGGSTKIELAKVKNVSMDSDKKEVKEVKAPASILAAKPTLPVEPADEAASIESSGEGEESPRPLTIESMSR